jgi:hypothetical protein
MLHNEEMGHRENIYDRLLKLVCKIPCLRDQIPWKMLGREDKEFRTGFAKGYFEGVLIVATCTFVAFCFLFGPPGTGLPGILTDLADFLAKAVLQ